MLMLFSRVTASFAPGFREFANYERAQSGNAHKEVLVKYVTLHQIFAGGHQNFPAQNQVGCHKANGRNDPQTQLFQQQSQPCSWEWVWLC